MRRSNFTLMSACLGNAFEHYDTALFGFLSPFLAPLIFPKHNPITALILTYAMIPLGMLARPLGSLVFGYIGDTYGRAKALFGTLGGMAIISAVIAISPTYLQVGILSPIIFCAGRIGQNFLAAGETIGGSVYLLENSEERHHDFLSSIYNASTIGGILLASAGVSLISSMGWLEFGWRVLYLFGCITALFGLALRQKVSFKPLTAPKMRGFWTFRKPLFIIMLSSGLAYANYSIAVVFINGFVPLVSHVTKTQMMGINTALLLFDFCALPFFGYIASKVGRERLMIFATLCIAITSVPLFTLLQNATIGVILAVRICFILFGVAFFAPFHAFAKDLIPASHRYTLISFGYSFGSLLLGGPTAMISLWAYKTTGIVSSAAWYLSILALVITALLAFQLRRQYAYKR